MILIVMNGTGRMQSNEVYGALVPLVGKEDDVHEKFWGKVRRTLGKVPFTDRAIAAYYAATDPATPFRVKTILFAALAYFILPSDLIPDILAGVGFVDDATVLLTVVQSLAPYISESHVARARAYLKSQA
ncbi:MAG TPA: YkvA family protein [Rhodospirillales bacterium]|nr:YkvA family protein [Rhodospirillales bacterium]